MLPGCSRPIVARGQESKQDQADQQTRQKRLFFIWSSVGVHRCSLYRLRIIRLCRMLSGFRVRLSGCKRIHNLESPRLLCSLIVLFQPRQKPLWGELLAHWATETEWWPDGLATSSNALRAAPVLAPAAPELQQYPGESLPRRR